VTRSALVVCVALVALGPLGVGSAAVRPLAGSLDPTFGRGGVVTHDLGSIAGIAVQPDGKIVAVGSGFLTARFLANGSFDRASVTELCRAPSFPVLGDRPCSCLAA
jgi:hypothetical protein